MGNRLAHLREAVQVLAHRLELVSVSAAYETAPMYVTDQPAFLNAALRARTELSPRALLALLKESERQIGRQVAPRNGPREIDLDLVGYGSLSYQYQEGREIRLIVPHPRTPERRFVLQPLADVAPDFVLAGLGRIDRLLAQTEGQTENVKRIEDALLPI